MRISLSTLSRFHMRLPRALRKSSTRGDQSCAARVAEAEFVSATPAAPLPSEVFRHRSSRTIRCALHALGACMATALLSGCLTDDADDDQAGVDDFPNSIYARVDAFLDQAEAGSGVGTVPPEAAELLDPGTVPVPPAPKRGAAAHPENLPALAKTTADSGLPVGAILFNTETKGNGFVKSDTVVYALDSVSADTILYRFKSVTRFEDGREESAEILDGDGDGRLSPPPPEGPHLMLILTRAQNGLLSENAALLVDPGPDGDLDRDADNRIKALSWTKLRGNDTLAFTVMADADGDGWVTGTDAESVVDVVLFQMDPPDKPEAAWQRLELRMRLFADGRPESLMRLFGVQGMRNGRTETIRLANSDGEPDFEEDRRVLAILITDGAEGETDTLLRSEARFEVDRGEDFSSEDDDRIFVLDLREEKRLGPEASAHFRLASATGFREGERPADGDFTMEIENRDGTEVKLTGEFSEGALSAEITDAEGRIFRIRWNAEGESESVERVGS